MRPGNETGRGHQDLGAITRPHERPTGRCSDGWDHGVLDDHLGFDRREVVPGKNDDLDDRRAALGGPDTGDIERSRSRTGGCKQGTGDRDDDKAMKHGKTPEGTSDGRLIASAWPVRILAIDRPSPIAGSVPA